MLALQRPNICLLLIEVVDSFSDLNKFGEKKFPLLQKPINTTTIRGIFVQVCGEEKNNPECFNVEQEGALLV